MLPRLDPSRFPTVRPRPELIDRLIERDGTPGEFRRGMSCPCVRPDTNRPELGCKVCRGHGIMYPAHLREPLIRALGSGRTATAALEAGGVVVTGDMKLTFPSRLRPTHYDLWLPRGDEHVVEERLHHQYDRVEDFEHLHRASWPYQPGDAPRDEPGLHNGTGAYDDRPTPRQREVLLYPAIRCVEAVVWRDARGDLVEGIEGVDWRLDTDGDAVKVAFLGARRPARGDAYTIRYRAPAAYVVGRTEPVAVMSGCTNLPMRCTLHRLDKRQHADMR